MASDYFASFVKKKTLNRCNLSSMHGNGGHSRGRRWHGGRGSWYRGGRCCGCGHGTRGNPIETELTDEQKDKVNKLRKAGRDNKCKMAAATSDNRDSKDNNQAGNAMNCKKKSGKQD
eukprot:14056393-Ditylum_brightwellii.AAC.1